MLNVFVKMNTRSVPLTAFDIIVARVEGETGESLHDLAVRTLLRRYLWRAFITNRYEFAAATSSFQDFRALLPAVKAEDATEPTAEILSMPLPDIDEIKMASWPKKRDRLARAILAVSFLGGAYDIADGSQITPVNAPHREYHHLFPVAYLRDKGIDEAAATVALNCALITWRTNRTIAAKAPLAYLNDRTASAPLGEEQIRDRLASHGIEYDDLALEDFDAFLTNRAELVRDAFQRLSAGASWPA